MNYTPEQIKANATDRTSTNNCTMAAALSIAALVAVLGFPVAYVFVPSRPVPEVGYSPEFSLDDIRKAGLENEAFAYHLRFTDTHPHMSNMSAALLRNMYGKGDEAQLQMVYQNLCYVGDGRPSLDVQLMTIPEVREYAFDVIRSKMADASREG